MLFFILEYFLPFYPTNSPKIQNLKKNEKKKKNPGDIILHKCTRNHDHMLYRSRDMAHDECNYFSFWAIFCPFNPLKAQKIKIKKKKKWKKAWSYHHLTHVYQKLWSDDVWFLRYGVWRMDRQTCRKISIFHWLLFDFEVLRSGTLNYLFKLKY